MANKYIIVNATALDKSGALSILQQFVENIPPDQSKWLIFIPENISISTLNHNVRLENISGVKQMYKRLWWDTLGLKNWLKKHNIKPLAAISLQNTGFRVGKNVPTFIYYHQPLPIYPNNWNPLKKQERQLWFYKNIYPFFVKFFLKKDTRIFVQLDYIKKGFHKKFHHDESLIDIFSPTVIDPMISEYSDCVSSKKSFFYPATDFFYKNHRIISEALKHIYDEDIDIYFTTQSKEEDKGDTRIKHLGTLSYTEVCKMYKNCDALLFPSYIETFGLPLLEAAMTGMPIIAADLPYTRNVLEGYVGVTYVDHEDPIAWANSIHNAEKGKRFNPIDISNRKGWKDLFNSIITNIN